MSNNKSHTTSHESRSSGKVHSSTTHSTVESAKSDALHSSTKNSDNHYVTDTLGNTVAVYRDGVRQDD